MARTLKTLVVLAMSLSFLLGGLTADAKKMVIKVPSTTTNPAVSTAYPYGTEKPAETPDSLTSRTQDNDMNEELRASLFPEKSFSLAFSHFTWGAEIGSSLDMTGHDLSTFDVDVLLGYKNSVLNVVGVGAGIHRSINSGNNLIPVYLVIRTDFRNKPSPLFMSIQSGYSFNTLKKSKTLGDWYGSLGLGINLSQTRIARTYVVLSVAYQNLSQESYSQLDFDTRHFFFAKLQLGVNF